MNTTPQKPNPAEPTPPPPPFYKQRPFLIGAAAIAVVAVLTAVFVLQGNSAKSGNGTAATSSASSPAAARAALKDAGWELGRPGDIVMGAPDAPVTMIEYASMTCPHCRVFKLQIFPDLKKKYIDTGLVRYTLREFPTPPVSLSVVAFQLARCTGENRYYGAIEALFRTQMQWVQPDPREARSELLKIAQQFGMDESQFDACLNNENEFKRINAVVDAGRDLFGINATPSFVVNGRKADLPNGPTFQAMDKLLKESLPEGVSPPEDSKEEKATDEESEGDTEEAAPDEAQEDAAEEPAGEDEGGAPEQD